MCLEDAVIMGEKSLQITRYTAIKYRCLTPQHPLGWNLWRMESSPLVEGVIQHVSLLGLLCLDLFIALYWSFCKLNFTIDSLISLILFSCKTTLCIGNLTFCKHLQIKLTIELFQFLHALNVKFCINLCKNELWT